MGLKKLPWVASRDEDRYYENIPKRVLFAIARDYAVANVGIGEAEYDPAAVLAELRRVEEIVRANGLDDRGV